jgi:hypothetical protein
MGDGEVFKARAVMNRRVVYFASLDGRTWYEVDGWQWQSRVHVEKIIEAGLFEDAPFERGYLRDAYGNIEFYGRMTRRESIKFGAFATELMEHAAKVRRKMSGAA